MKVFVFTGLGVLSVALLSSCAHHRDVRPSPDGVHRVQVQAEDKERGSREAIDQANHFCEERGKSAAFVEESQEYTGDLDEDTYRNAKRASTVAKTVGGATRVFGGKKEGNIGGIVGLGGVAVDSALGEGYTVEMRFKCM